MDQVDQISFQPQFPEVPKACDHIFITFVRAAGVTGRLRRLPIGFYATVEVGERIIQTSTKAVLTDQDAVEWDEEILIPSDQLSSILFGIYASFELGPMHPSGELLYQFHINVNEVHQSLSQQLELAVESTVQDDILPSCSPLRITTERRTCHADGSCPALPPPHTLDVLEELTDKGHRALLRYRQQQDQTNLDTAIRIFEGVQDICPINHPNRSAILFRLANAKFINCQANDRCLDLDVDVPIKLYQNALHLKSSDSPDHYTVALELAYAILARFQKRGVKIDSVQAIALLRGVVEVSAPNSYARRAGNFALRMAKASVLLMKGDARPSQAKQVNRDDLVQMTWVMLGSLSYWNPRQPVLLALLGVLLRDRFQRNGELADIHEAITTLEHAKDHVLRNSLKIPAVLNNLGDALWCRFERLSNLTDLNRSISFREEAIHLTPNSHLDKPTWLHDLGRSYFRRYECLDDLMDLDKAISMREEAVFLTPNGHANKPGFLNNLGIFLLSRFERLGELVDLNKYISTREEADSLVFRDHPDKPIYLNNLGSSLLNRFQRLGDLIDLNRSISVLEEAVFLTPSEHPAKPSHLNSLGNSIFRRFERLGDIADLNRSIMLREEAIRLTPNSHPDKQAWLNNLGGSLFRRFEHLGDLAELNKSILIFEEAISLAPDGHSDKPTLLSNLGWSLFRRLDLLGDIADLNRSVLIFEEAACLTPDGHSDRPDRLNKLGSSLLRCFERLKDLTDLYRSNSLLEEANRLTPDGHLEKPARLNNLGKLMFRRFEHLGDSTDLNRSIPLFEEAVSLIPDGHPLKLVALGNFGSSFFRRFEHLREITDVSKSISLKQEAINIIPDDHPDKPELLTDLGHAFYARFKRTHDSADLSAAASHFSVASRSTIGPVSIRFLGVRAWISSLQSQKNLPDLLDAYTITLGLLPQLAWLGFPVSERHGLLTEAADVSKGSVAAALEAGRPELAVEWLEQGRSIVWNQLFQLRSPVDDLRHEHCSLARQLQQISQALEQAGSRNNTTFHRLEYGSVVGSRSLEEQVQRHHDLALRREKLLVEIRSLPGFDRFLLPMTIKQLANLAISGPVVYLTASKKRCDALIVMAERESVVPVPLLGTCHSNIEVLRRALRVLLEQDRLIIPRDAICELIPLDDKVTSTRFLDSLLDDGGPTKNLPFFVSHSLKNISSDL